MNRESLPQKTYDIKMVFLLMVVCLFSLTIGNILLHAKILLFSENVERYIMQHFGFEVQHYSSIGEFLWAVIFASRRDILCVILISLSHLVKCKRLFIASLFAYRSFLFGFSGAYIIKILGSFSSFFQGCFSWLLFFLYHILFFALLICFGAQTASIDFNNPHRRVFSYLMTIVGEIALLILLNVIYYFLISIL